MSPWTAQGAKRIKLDFTELVSVLVGKDEEKFVIHRDVLTKHSTFFRAALEGQFREAHEKVVRMPEGDAEAFAVYCQWAYNNTLVLLEPDEAAKDEKALKRTKLMIKTYIVADQVCNIMLQNQIVDEYAAVLEKLKIGPNSNSLKLIYDNLPDKSGLRKFALHWYLAHVKIDWLEENIDDIPDAFAKDLAIGFGRAADKGARTSASEDTCDFHFHNEDAPTCSKGKIKADDG